MPGSIPKDKYININTISQDIDRCINDYCKLYNIDISDYKIRTSIKHNEVNHLLRYIYQQLFKPDITLCNHQKSYIDYNNIELLQVISDKFIDICLMFNKSLGLMSFSLMTGINYKTIYNWINSDNGDELNVLRLQVIENVRQFHKMEQISLLNDSPVGALAVANNDVETGLEWSKQQAALNASSSVFILPSERLDALRISKEQD